MRKRRVSKTDKVVERVLEELGEGKTLTSVCTGDDMPVRRHINWNNQRPDLKEDLAHLV